MDYIFHIDVTELRTEGFSEELISIWYTNARELCRRDKLLATLHRNTPLFIENIVGYVTDIRFSHHGSLITIKLETVDEVQEDIITDAKELNESMSAGLSYDAKFGKEGKYITLIKKENGWRNRSYVILD